MAKLNFEHDGAKYSVKGEWDGNVFTAQAFKGKKPASDPFTLKKEKKNMADDSALEAVVMESAKDDVISGNGVSGEDA